MLLIRNISHLVTFSDQGELTDVDVLIDGGQITAVGADLAAPAQCEVRDGTGWLVTPGLINAHHHLYQVAMRAIPELERALIGPWLAGLGKHGLHWWKSGVFGPDQVSLFAQAGMAESLVGGVTTVADQHYFHPAGRTQPYIEGTIEAAGELGLRLHATRGTLTLGRANGGGAAPELVQSMDEVLRHAQDLIETYHDPRPGAMVRVALAPCGVHADVPELFDRLADLAADYAAVRLHTHLYEQVDSAFCRERYGCTPWQFLREHGWAQERTWLAHVVDIPRREIGELAAAGVSVAHLPAPDLRMGFGLSPVREMLAAGVTVGFGTTGCASNDGSNLLGDMRLAALAHRIQYTQPEDWLSAREVLHAATRGSALCLGREDLGVVAPGYAADLACWDLTRVDRVGVHDPVAGLVLTGLSDAAELVVVDGQVVVDQGRLTGVDEDDLARAAHRAARELMEA